MVRLKLIYFYISKSICNKLSYIFDMMKRLCYILIFCFSFSLVQTHIVAQTTKKKENKAPSKPKKKKLKRTKKPKVKGVPYPNEFSVKGGINSNAWQIALNYNRYFTEKRAHLFELELSELKHPKEKKRNIEQLDNGPFQSTSRSYVHGKSNVVLPLRLGYGQKLQLGKRAFENGIAINGFTYVGVNFALQKPYYVRMYDFKILVDTTVKFQNENYEYFLGLRDSLAILGNAGFGKGLNEIKIVPALYNKTGVKFDFSGESRFIKALEAGIITDFYFNKPQLLVFDDYNKRLHFTLYLSIEFGNRW